MGVPAEKVTNRLVSAEDDLRYVLGVLKRNNQDIYGEGRAAVDSIVALALRIRAELDRGCLEDGDGREGY